MIRVYQQGWARDRAARQRDEIAAAVRIERIEIDVDADSYVTIPGALLSAVRTVAEAGFQTTDVSLVGAVEYRYVDADGNEIAGSPGFSTVNGDGIDWVARPIRWETP